MGFQTVAFAGDGSLSAPGTATGASATQQGMQADAQSEAASSDVSYMLDWVKATRDNGDMPYVIIDKVNARVFVLDAQGRAQGSAPALLGMVRGDASIAGIGDLKLSAIRPDERTTPAGRYVASLGRDPHGQDLLWIDYDNALALHRVVKGTPAEHRADRLQTRTSDDNRISYGCINVPVSFYEGIVKPAFTGTSGVVYILPEMSSVRDMFKPRNATAQSGRAPAQGPVAPGATAPSR